jgi:hypothetical protein
LKELIIRCLENGNVQIKYWISIIYRLY